MFHRLIYQVQHIISPTKSRTLGSDLIGVNLDFSHLIWQRMDPILVIRELKGMIYHMHAKDIVINEQMVKENSYICRTYFHDPNARPWNFRIIGYGHDLGYWRNIFAELRRVGYEYVSSIEFECEITSAEFGCKKALKNLKECILSDDVNDPLSWTRQAKAGKEMRDKIYGIGQ